MRARTMWITGVVLLCTAVGAGCSQKSPAESGQAGPSAAKTSPPAPSAPAEASPGIPDGETSGDVTLAGVLGCGHCTYHVTPECAAVVKTGSGQFYVLDGVGEGSELWEKRLEGNRQISVTGTVMGTDKVKHLAMTSFDLK